MTNTHSPDTTLVSLEGEIAGIYQRFKSICSETASIVSEGSVPDAALQLTDVIAASEAAATTILECGAAIGMLIEDQGVPDAVRAGVNEQLSRIYEASGFQDIGAQRIMKVLKGLQMLEQQLGRLAGHAGHKGNAFAAQPETLLNGPQLTKDAPSQNNIDALFGE